MNFKDLILPISLALLTTWAIQYFFFGNSSKENEVVQSGQSFTAPKTKQELKPRNTQVEFADVSRTKEEQKTLIETNGARLTFSSDGAILEQLEFKQISKGAGSLKTIAPVATNGKENGCFLVAMAQKTPYYYELESRVDGDTKTELHYKADFDGGVIRKKFIVYKNTYKIDLELHVQYAKSSAQHGELRIIFPSPSVTELAKDDVINVIANNEKGNLVKTARDKFDVEQGRFSPSLFGMEDKYFVHSMIEDPNNFVARAYYKVGENNMLYAMLEGPVAAPKTEATNENHWKVSFYFGPKEECALSAVDPRLEQTLDYSGILAPISKFLLSILKMIYCYVKNYGLAIIAMTLLVKLLLVPFTFRAEESMKARIEFDKKLRYIQQKYKDTPELLAKERAELIQKHGMPGLSGCLPLLLQLPIFFALSRVLSSSIELYRAPFLWISDLSIRDPYYILPVLTALTMAVQGLSTPGNDPKQRIQTLVMALIIGAVTVTLPAGLALYIWMFTLLGIVQAPLIKLFKRS